ncbi:MAG: putative sugar O-methyltransferase [Chloroflexi bacterium]|nr:putative sugar O-methyltransferase [Chloroflexota bacterium]
MPQLEQFRERVESASKSHQYSSYLHVKQAVFDMLDRMSQEGDAPSDYWSAEVKGIEYLLDASPLLVQTLRSHCYHLTGIQDYDYRGHHSLRMPHFQSKYEALAALDSWGLFVPEDPRLGGFGHELDAGLTNVDTLKFYEVLIGLKMAGMIPSPKESESSPERVLEIGGGWGGFAYQYKTLFPKTKYVIIDLPQTLLFSGTYLLSLFPEASSQFISSGEELANAASQDLPDFTFIPHYLTEELGQLNIDLAINMVSFQEMTTEQVSGYARVLRDGRCANLYSLNRERSRYNDQLTGVINVLSQHYRMDYQDLLPIQYTELVIPRKVFGPLELLRNLAIGNRRRAIGQLRSPLLNLMNGQLPRKKAPISIHAYRHAFGRLS